MRMSDVAARKKLSAERMGSGNPMYGKKLSEEHKRRISESNKGKPRSEKQLIRIRDLNKGKHLSEKTKQKISNTKKGFKHTKESIANMIKAHTGIKRSEEACENMSIAQKKIKHNKLTDETKLKISMAHKGKPKTQEHRKHLSETKKIMAANGKLNYFVKPKDKHHNWKGGVTSAIEKIRKSIHYVIWRQSCFIRDNFTCKKCEIQGGDLNVHHKKLFSVLAQEAKDYMPLLTLYDACMVYATMWDTNNGITLCENCHKKSGRHKLK